MKHVLILILLGAEDISRVQAKLSKCAQNFLKNKEETREKTLEEWRKWDDDEAIELSGVLGQLDNPSSRRLYPDSIRDLYPECGHVDRDNYSPSPSILIDFNNGRLGNQISSVASTFCLAKKMKMSAFMVHKTKIFLEPFFDSLDDHLQVLESKFCEPWADLNFQHISKMKSNQGQILYLQTYSNLLELYPECLPDLKNVLKVKKKYLDQAKEFVDQTILQSKKIDHLIVTIHNRRTDMVVMNNKSPGRDRFGRVTPKYFHNAMDYVRRQYGDNIIFLVISDDVEWSRRNIVGEHVYYSDNDGSTAGVAADLALMVTAQLSILSHGTFGQWGAQLADHAGDIIVPPDHDLEVLINHDNYHRNIHVVLDV